MIRIIAGEWGGRRIRVPEGRDVRPTSDRVREAWMSALGSRVVGARVLDLFSGSGALGLECLSRGARQVVFVERSRTALGVLRENLESLGAKDRGQVRPGDVFRFLDRELASVGTGAEASGDDSDRRGRDGSDVMARFDLALADPPYRQGLAARLIDTYSRRPFATELWVEHASDEPIPDRHPLHHRRYGDTMLTMLSAGDLEAFPTTHSPDENAQ